MLKRVDTTNIARGDLAHIAIFTKDEPTLKIYFFDCTTHTVEEKQYTLENKNNYYLATTKTNLKDGYILAKINSKYNFVKKVGHPTPHFVIGYKAGYTIPFKLYDIDGNIIKAGNLKNIVDSFYYTEVGSDIEIIDVLNTKLILGRTETRLDYEVDMDIATINNIELPNYDLNVSLQDIELPNAQLQNIDLDIIVANVNIRN